MGNFSFSFASRVKVICVFCLLFFLLLTLQNAQVSKCCRSRVTRTYAIEIKVANVYGGTERAAAFIFSICIVNLIFKLPPHIYQQFFLRCFFNVNNYNGRISHVATTISLEVRAFIFDQHRKSRRSSKVAYI